MSNLSVIFMAHPPVAAEAVEASRHVIKADDRSAGNEYAKSHAPYPVHVEFGKDFVYIGTGEPARPLDEAGNGEDHEEPRESRQEKPVLDVGKLAAVKSWRPVIFGIRK